MEKSNTLARERKERSERKYGLEKVSSALKEGGFQRGERGKAQRTSMGKEGESPWEKIAWKVLISLQVWPNLKPERRLGEGPTHKMTGRNESG